MKKPAHRLSLRVSALVTLLLLIGGCDYRDQYVELDIREASKNRDTNFFVLYATNLNDPVPRRQPGNTSYAILIAAEQGAVDLIPFLLHKRADVTVTDSRGRGVLHCLLNSVDKIPDDLLSAIIKKGVDINLRDRSGMSALHHAALYGSAEALPSLIQNGAKLDVRNMYGDMPLHFARNVESAKLLVAHGASLTATNDAGETPAKAAASRDHPDVYRFLLSQKPAR